VVGSKMVSDWAPEEVSRVYAELTAEPAATANG
jgi:hypothetical protein